MTKDAPCRCKHHQRKLLGHAYSDNPDRDSLDGNLPSSSHGTGNPPPPPEPSTSAGPLSPTGFTKGPNAKNKKHKKMKTEESKDKKKEKSKDLDGGKWTNAEPCNDLWIDLSSMYGKLVVLMTVAFCLTEVMDNSIVPLTFQGVFLMYLYVGSILAILCIYISVVIDNCPSLTSSKENLTSQVDPEIGSITSFGTLKKAHISRSKTARTSFYLRVGALVFGFGTLVFNGLEIAMHSTLENHCAGDLVFAHPILQALFTFLQMHFLFVNSEVIVEKFGQVARFGLMHLVATNLAVWIRMIIWESASEWIHFVHLHAFPDKPLQYGGTPSPVALHRSGVRISRDVRDSGVIYYGDPYYNPNGETSTLPPCAFNMSFPSVSREHAMRVIRLYECFNNNTLGQMWTKSMPYLFPFLVGRD